MNQQDDDWKERAEKAEALAGRLADILTIFIEHGHGCNSEQNLTKEALAAYKVKKVSIGLASLANAMVAKEKKL